MINYSLEAQQLNKSFGRRLIFNDLTFKFDKPGVYGISGPNGSGKSTLVKIIAGIIAASKGKIIHLLNGKIVTEENLHNHIGFVSPYLVLYEEFSTLENLKLFADIRGTEFNKERVDYLLNKFLLYKRKDDLLKTYSSGMKQRVKFIFALMHSPQLLILDEPTSNLDEEGKNSVYEIVKEESKTNIVIVASNERNDLELCDEIVLLEKYKS
ncbi:MAG TPA: ABC transporter ATP-binding protein [Ignavibacteriaceae bacterium]|jgi:heme exporter protein A|nr:MAG: Daunorubicin/doxorubicin resistance ATP-binding protein DrrA [Ignavibacteria bacterium ADurb.Bin266]OQY70971.1 MAG: ABC transporter ATP-binding protein [Ignavibacteriales bacterium UTCHB2]HQF41561.1 ABC transporter ATP-binding protein [Ignavibacteriaceae bacterium]HQI42077.1 ABC transporter ATP-binding protein [Ignavibacteriaceae bacterium]HQJ45554.1 ABC transporter ATP-binding protein [Ignavibacteriaceae bacterium]